MTSYIDICIRNESKTNRQYLLNLARDPKLDKNTNVIYIYSLVGEAVNYPIKCGHVIYIGEAGRSSEPTGRRFGQHISKEASVGGDSGTIYALSQYYWLGNQIRLRIFLVESREKRKEHERSLLRAHVKEYGALPICQWTTGENYKTTELSTLTITNDHRALIGPASNISPTKAPGEKAAQCS